MDLTQSIKFIFWGVLLGSILEMCLMLFRFLISKVRKRFPNLISAQHDKKSKDNEYIDELPVAATKMAAGWLAILSALASGLVFIAGLSVLFKDLTPYIFLLIGVPMGFVFTSYLAQFVNELRNTS